ncbi:MAG: 5-deoxy-glucuronate isomerase [Bryobacteraceae bacterium]
MTSTEPAAIRTETCVVRNTGARKGRHLSVTPQTTASRHLYYGRIVLDCGDAPVEVKTGERETGLVCLRGGGTVQVGDAEYKMGRYDALYIPRASKFQVAAGADGCDFAELSAPAEKAYPLQFVSFAEVQKDPGLHFTAGCANAQRDLNILIGKNVQAGRIVAGVTFSKPGNWTSWPPHEHAAMLEEAYLYIDMPAPAFGVQFVYTDTVQPELATFVRDGDVVLMPKGYHPNVAAPGSQVNFLWMMAANREGEDRQFGVVNVQPEFAVGGSGLERGQAGR